MNSLHDFNDLLKVIKKAAIDAVNASKPTSIVYGKVISIEPLQINVEQKITLTDAQLILTRNVTDYEINVTMDWLTENITHSHSYTDDGSGATTGSNTHQHQVIGDKKITIHNKLIVGDTVVMIQAQGGQKYIVMDRIKI